MQARSATGAQTSGSQHTSGAERSAAVFTLDGVPHAAQGVSAVSERGSARASQWAFWAHCEHEHCLTGTPLLPEVPAGWIPLSQRYYGPPARDQDLRRRLVAGQVPGWSLGRRSYNGQRPFLANRVGPETYFGFGKANLDPMGHLAWRLLVSSATT